MDAAHPGWAANVRLLDDPAYFAATGSSYFRFHFLEVVLVRMRTWLI